MGELIDLTMPLSPKTIPVPGHPSPGFEPLHRLDRDGIRNTIITMSIHTGTHIDAPSHVIEDGATIDEISVDRFRRPGVRVDLTSATPNAPISPEQLRAGGFDPERARGKILLLATGWTLQAWQDEALYGQNPFLSQEAAQAIADAGPSALGLDFAVDQARPWPNHTILLGAGVPLIENLMGLPALPAEGLEVMAFPLRLVGENGGPARVICEVTS